MVMMTMAAAPAHGLRQILHVGELAAFRGVAEIRRQLVQLARGRGISARCGRLRGALQVGRNLLRHLRILGRVRLLELLERAHQLGERGYVAVVRLA
jgi:hypothetical protein